MRRHLAGVEDLQQHGDNDVVGQRPHRGRLGVVNTRLRARRPAPPLPDGAVPLRSECARLLDRLGSTVEALK